MQYSKEPSQQTVKSPIKKPTQWLSSFIGVHIFFTFRRVVLFLLLAKTLSPLPPIAGFFLPGIW
jgi:hypothetical protein